MKIEINDKIAIYLGFKNKFEFDFFQTYYDIHVTYISVGFLEIQIDDYTRDP